MSVSCQLSSFLVLKVTFLAFLSVTIIITLIIIIININLIIVLIACAWALFRQYCAPFTFVFVSFLFLSERPTSLIIISETLFHF